MRFGGDDEVPPAHRWVALYAVNGLTLAETLDVPCVHDDPAVDATFHPTHVFGSADGDAVHIVMVSQDEGASAVVTAPL